MRYFKISAEEKNPQPRFTDWFKKLQPKAWQDREVYNSLAQMNHMKIRQEQEAPLFDIISHPYFMVSKEFADVIRMYDEKMKFKQVILFEPERKRSAFYQIPNLQEVECLLKEGCLAKEKLPDLPIFRLGKVDKRCILANLEVVESLYRREVKGMSIQEYVVY